MLLKKGLWNGGWSIAGACSPADWLEEASRVSARSGAGGVQKAGFFVKPIDKPGIAAYKTCDTVGIQG